MNLRLQRHVTIRTAVERDLPAILAIYNDAVLHTTASYDYEPSTLDARIAWFETKVLQSLPVFVTDESGEVIGWSTLNPFRPWAGYRYTVEHSMYVTASRRGQGIGQALVAPLIDGARALGMHAMIAGIDANNIASIRLHTSFGFVKVAHFRAVGYKFDRWLDLVCMELLLEDLHPTSRTG